VKGGLLEEACHLVSIAVVTASALTPHLWVHRSVDAYANLGITNGWIFCNQKGEPDIMRVYKPYMFELIQRAQEGGTVAERLLQKDEDITVSHGIVRSARRGNDTHTSQTCGHCGCGY
jgi:hypothetical protein